MYFNGPSKNFVAVTQRPRTKSYNSFLIDITKPKIQNKQLAKFDAQKCSCQTSTRYSEDCSPTTTKESLPNTPEILVSPQWTKNEVLSYYCFLLRNFTVFETGQDKAKYYTAMSSFIGSKTPPECFSYHKEQLERHSTIINIVRYLDTKFGEHSRKSDRSVREAFARLYERLNLCQEYSIGL